MTHLGILQLPKINAAANSPGYYPNGLVCDTLKTLHNAIPVSDMNEHKTRIRVVILTIAEAVLVNNWAEI